jgi:membrane protein YdbS with pleckstrin-like domain
MKQTNLILKYSPFVFLKRLVVVEFIFAFLPAVAAAFFGPEDVYAQMALARSLPFSVLWVLLVTTLQIAIIGVVFFWWYIPSYVISVREIVWNRGGFYGPKVLANTFMITHVETHQGVLGRRFEYGTLRIYVSDQKEPVELHHLENPEQVRRLVEEMVHPELAQTMLAQPRPVQELIAGGETQEVEFKASLQWDYRQSKRNKELYEPVMKNLTAFMNTAGGYVLIGVDDEGEVLGLEPDYNTMGKKNSDGFENVFNMAFNKMVGPEYRQYVEVVFPTVAGKEICVARANPAVEPVFLTHKGKESFYIRTGNTSQPLTVSKAARYIEVRFQK